MLRAAMSSTPTEHEHHGPHPALPTVHDEAGDTPMWLPILGIALFVLMAFAYSFRGAMMSTDEGVGDAAAAEAVAEEAPPAEAE